MLDDADLEAGDTFHLHYYLAADTAVLNADVWILLDVYGDYWFYPDWLHVSDGVDFKEGVNVMPGSMYTETVLNFPWPAQAGNAEGLYFWGAAFFTGTFDIYGDFESIPWGYR